MKLVEYYEFVRQTDVSKDKSIGERRRIGVLGLVSEIGSILSVLKKSSLRVNGGLNQWIVKGSLKEEIGDAVWYATMLSQILEEEDYLNPEFVYDVFSGDIAMLLDELSGDTLRQKKVQKTLGKKRVEKFLRVAKNYLNKKRPTVSDYQKTAYITARTQGAELRDICAALLLQLSAQCIREFLPSSELNINEELVVRPVAETIGKILWHLSALASLHVLSMEEILQQNVAKSKFRNHNGYISKRYDLNFQENEKFPTRFEVKFTDDGNGKTLMTWEKENERKRLGDPLTDNNHEGDGYRFHDVMHLSFAVHLGWSPVLRGFMDRKRKSDSNVDRVEDGGRAKILEEMIILQIHTHAKKIGGYSSSGKYKSPFEHSAALNFEFLKSLHELTVGHEVEANPVQDWKAAIKDGYENFMRLNENNGGTILADMKLRKLTFRPPND